MLVVFGQAICWLGCVNILQFYFVYFQLIICYAHACDLPPLSVLCLMRVPVCVFNWRCTVVIGDICFFVHLSINLISAFVLRIYMFVS